MLMAEIHNAGAGTALSRDSRVWFAVSHGIANDIHCQRIDQTSACAT